MRGTMYPLFIWGVSGGPLIFQGGFQILMSTLPTDPHNHGARVEGKRLKRQLSMDKNALLDQLTCLETLHKNCLANQQLIDLRLSL